jgi:hypothetical protein
MLSLLGLAPLEGRKHAEKADHHQSESLTMLRVMVIGYNVKTVQRISRYCLELGADVFPYYGSPGAEEVALFNPQVSVLCLPLAENWLCQMVHQFCILWSEEPRDGFPLASTRTELETHFTN